MGKLVESIAPFRLKPQWNLNVPGRCEVIVRHVLTRIRGTGLEVSATLRGLQTFFFFFWGGGSEAYIVGGMVDDARTEAGKRWCSPH